MELLKTVLGFYLNVSALVFVSWLTGLLLRREPPSKKFSVDAVFDGILGAVFWIVWIAKAAFSIGKGMMV